MKRLLIPFIHIKCFIDDFAKLCTIYLQYGRDSKELEKAITNNFGIKKITEATSHDATIDDLQSRPDF